MVAWKNGNIWARRGGVGGRPVLNGEPTLSMSGLVQ